MKILDWYILKRYLATFFVMILIFIPIGIMVDVAEKAQRLSRAPADEILVYYLNFIIYFANILFPIFLFLSVIWFTSLLTNRTEIVAILSSGISYNRFLRPYIYGATLLGLIGFGMSMFLVPYSSKVYYEFFFKYLRPVQNDGATGSNLFNQISKDKIIYVSYFDSNSKEGNNFSFEVFNGINLKEKISASHIKYIENDSVKTYRLKNYVKRIVGEKQDILIKEASKDTLFSFKPEDLVPVQYAAETKNLFELNDFIEKERLRGSSNISLYEMVRYKRWSFILTTFILTFIGVAVSSVKRRGGMGVNLAFGILIGFSYVFLDRIFNILADKSGLPPFWAVAIPNIMFLILAIFLLKKARQ